MPLLYCVKGRVVAWYDNDQGVPASEYGPDATIIPWPNIRALPKIGVPPKNSYDDRPYAAPVLKGPEQLIPYAKFKQQRLVTGGVEIDFGKKYNPRILALATDANSMVQLHAVLLHATSDKVDTDTFNLIGLDHKLHVLNADQVKLAVSAVNAFVAGSNTTLAKIIDAINQGFVENQEQIDKPPKPLPAWPSRTLAV